MAKPSAFRDFIGALRKHWRSELPTVRPVQQSFGPMMPKASTFYAGIAHPLELHVFLWFQHSSYAWKVGRFTVNIIFSPNDRGPENLSHDFTPTDGVSFSGGRYYRIGCMIGDKDKWWNLKDNRGSRLTDTWRPSSYEDYDAVLSQAVADVTSDIRKALTRIGVDTGAVSSGS